MSTSQATVGTKRVRLPKVTTPGTDDSPKKKALMLEKRKEGSSMPLRKTLTSSMNVSSNNCTTKNQNFQHPQINQSKKIGQVASINHSKSFPKTSSRIVDSANANKRTTTGGPKLSTTNTRRVNTPKESAGSFGKTSGKVKTASKLTERVLKTSSLHPVAFLRDESKTFKDKLAKKAIKSRPASNISNASTIIIDEVRPNIEQQSNAWHHSDENASSDSLELADHFHSSISIEENIKTSSTSCGDHCDSSGDFLKNTEYDDKVNQCAFTNGLPMDHGDYFNNTPNKESISETEYVVSTDLSNENEFENDMVEEKVGLLDNTNMLFMQSSSNDIVRGYKHFESGSVNKNFTELKKVKYDNPTTSWAIDPEAPGPSMMQQPLEARRTFIFEEPPSNINLRECFIREISREQNEEIETELYPLREESSISVLQDDESASLEDYAYQSPKTPEKYIYEKDDDKTGENIINNKNSQIGHTSSESDTVNSQEALEETYNPADHISEFSTYIIRKLLSSEEGTENRTRTFKRINEFGEETEETLHIVDLSKCVWLGQMQLHDPEDAWKEYRGVDPIPWLDDEGNVLVPIDERDEKRWMEAERNYQELRACLQRSVCRSVSNQELRLCNYSSDTRENSACNHDDDDYFSVSSGDELNENDANNISPNLKLKYTSYDNKK